MTPSAISAQDVSDFVTRHELFVNTEMVLRAQGNMIDWRHNVRMRCYMDKERKALQEHPLQQLLQQNRHMAHWVQRHREWVETRFRMYHLRLFVYDNYMTLDLLNQVLYCDLIDTGISETYTLASSFVALHPPPLL